MLETAQVVRQLCERHPHLRAIKVDQVVRCCHSASDATMLNLLLVSFSSGGSLGLFASIGGTQAGAKRQPTGHLQPLGRQRAVNRGRANSAPRSSPTIGPYHPSRNLPLLKQFRVTE